MAPNRMSGCRLRAHRNRYDRCMYRSTTAGRLCPVVSGERRIDDASRLWGSARQARPGGERGSTMSGQFVRGLDRCARVMQDLLGSRATQYLQATLGSKGTRSVREFLDRSPRHRVEVYRNKELCGSGIASWIICPDTLTSEGIVYSFGVGDNIAFDLELIESFGVHVFAFDPTPDSVAWIKSQDVPREFH